jgi:transcriptional regulator with XRE-family HTH domain
MKISNNQNIIAIREELLKRLREERINQGLSQKDVAQRSGLSLDGYFQNGEREKTSVFRRFFFI